MTHNSQLTTHNFGLIGFPLSHSFSKKYFTEKFAQQGIQNYSYELFPMENIAELPALLNAHPQLIGLNVTIPHKVNVMPLLQELDETAVAVGAVNTIVVKRAENREVLSLKGYNTDVYGFEHSLKPLLKAHHTQALVLGNGGAAKAVVYVLQKLGIDYKIVTRASGNTNNSKVLNYENLSPTHITQHPLLINTTPLGTAPNVDSCPPIPYEAITAEHLLYDLVYNPAITAFMKQGLVKGATVQNGMAMLVGQAEKAWEIWNTP